MLPNGIALGLFRSHARMRATKKARTPVRASQKVPASTQKETRKLEARQTAHLRAFRLLLENFAGFSVKR